MEEWFEYFEGESIAFDSAAPCALAAAGYVSGVAANAGSRSSWAVPVHDGNLAIKFRTGTSHPKQLRRFRCCYGGDAVDFLLREMLGKRLLCESSGVLPC